MLKWSACQPCLTSVWNSLLTAARAAKHTLGGFNVDVVLAVIRILLFVWLSRSVKDFGKTWDLNFLWFDSLLFNSNILHSFETIWFIEVFGYILKCFCFVCFAFISKVLNYQHMYRLIRTRLKVIRVGSVTDVR